MKIMITAKISAILLLSAALVWSPSGNAGKKITKPWVTGYLTGEWHRQDQNWTIGILNDDDWNTLTHIIHHAAGLNSDGSLNMDYQGLGDQAKRTAIINQAHAKGVYVLFSVVHFGAEGYANVLNDEVKRRRFIDSLITVLQNGDDPGYDGLDMDLEPVTEIYRRSSDGAIVNSGYELFINELHTRMKTIDRTSNPGMLVERPLLAIATGLEIVTDNAVGNTRKLLARIQDKLDQINVMAYDLSTIDGGITWHDGALYDGGNTYPTNPARSVMSANRGIQQFIDGDPNVSNDGILPSKLGLGISGEVRVWRGGKVSGAGNPPCDGVTALCEGVTAPLQAWTGTGVPSSWDNDGLVDRGRYSQLVKPSYKCICIQKDSSGCQVFANYECSYKPEYYRWDNAAKMPYLSINKQNSDADMFISYNDPRSVAEKVRYVKEKGLGGVMLWELGRECLPSGAGGSMNQCVPGDGKYRPLMKAIRQTLRTGTGKFRPLPVQP